MKLLAVFCIVSVVSMSSGQFRPTGIPPLAEETTTAEYPYYTTWPTWGYEGPRLCWVGTRSVDSEGRVTSDTAFPSLCRGGQNYCAYFRYNITSEGNTYYSQTGYCVEDPAEATCELFAPYASFFGTVDSCWSNVCRESTYNYACNQFEGEAGSCPERSLSADIQLFPNCTLQESIRSVFECAGILFEGYPFDNQAQCSNTWDRAVACFARTATRCLASNCESVLDGVQGLRSEYPGVVLNTIFINDVGSLSDRLEAVLGIDVQSVLVPLVCSGDPTGVVVALGQLQAQLAALNVERLLISVGIPLDSCPGIVDNVQNAFFQFIPAVVGATTPNDVTSAFSDLQGNLLGALRGCDTLGIFGQISALLNTFDISVPVGAVVNVIQSLGGLFGGFGGGFLPFPTAGPFPGPGPNPGPGPGPNPLPGACPAESYRPDGFGQVRLNCERFYDDTSRCGRRRAWLCDYSSWRLNFLRSWRAESVRNGEDVSRWALPSCRREDDVRCARSQRCCYTTYDGCVLCFCRQHDYLDPGFLEGRWGEESSAWDRFFNIYQNTVSNNTEEEHDDDDEDTC